MAIFIGKGGDIFPIGTVVSIYVQSEINGWPSTPSLPASPLTTAVVGADSRYTVTGLDHELEYAAYANGRWVSFTPKTPDEDVDLGPVDVRDFLAVGDGITDDTIAVRAAVATGRDVYFPTPPANYISVTTGGYLVNGIIAQTVQGQRLFGDGARSLILQGIYGMMTFDVRGTNDVWFDGLAFAYPGVKAAVRPTWLYAGQDSATNDLYNVDSTVSRSAFIYGIGCNRLRVTNCYFSNVYAGIRLRSLDRTTQTCVDNVVESCHFTHFQFGLLVMNQTNPRIVGLHGYLTDATDATPPHLIYCSGVGLVPADVSVGGSEGVDGDGLTDPPAGTADTPIVGGLIADCVDYGNPYSTSYKLRNLRGTRCVNLVSEHSARASEISWCQDVTVQITAHDMIQVLNVNTHLPVDSPTQSIVQTNFCSRTTVDVDLQGNGEYTSGVTQRNNCVDTRVKGRVSLSYATGSTSSRTALKGVGVNRPIWEDIVVEIRGADRPALSFSSVTNAVINRPRIIQTSSGYTGALFVFDSASSGNKVVLDTDKVTSSPTVTGVKSDAGTGNTVTLVSSAAATWTQPVGQSVVALTDASTIALNAALGNLFRVTLAGSRTMGAPTNPLDGQRILIAFKQDATGGRTITWNAVFRFSDDLPTATLSTTAGRTDYIGFVYNGADARWDCLGAVKGFA